MLGVAPREVSIMFSDIVGFTTIAESLEPDLLVNLLAEYLQAMSDCIQVGAHAMMCLHPVPCQRQHL